MRLIKLSSPLLLLTSLVLSVVIAPIKRIDQEKNRIEHTYSDTNLMTDNQIEDYGLINLGEIDAANQGPYRIRGYHHPECGGSIAILPLHRNAEGSKILKQLLDDQNLKYGVIFQGQIHEEFPQLDFAIEKLRKALSRILNNQTHPKSTILAFAEDGHCDLAINIAQHTH